MKRLFFLNYAIIAFIVTVMMFTIYTVAQQNYRTGLNDPQVAIARDMQTQVNHGKPINPFFRTDPVDISNSLSPFAILYDANGKPIMSDALLHDNIPQLPAGIFDVVRKKEEHYVSWQPEHDVRMAMVIIKTNTDPVQFIAVGRSMELVEERIQAMTMTIFITWAVFMLIIVFMMMVNRANNKKHNYEKI